METRPSECALRWLRRRSRSGLVARAVARGSGSGVGVLPGSWAGRSWCLSDESALPRQRETLPRPRLSVGAGVGKGMSRGIPGPLSGSAGGVARPQRACPEHRKRVTAWNGEKIAPSEVGEVTNAAIAGRRASGRWRALPGQSVSMSRGYLRRVEMRGAIREPHEGQLPEDTSLRVSRCVRASLELCLVCAVGLPSGHGVGCTRRRV